MKNRNTIDLYSLAAERRQIVCLWGIEDVQEIRPDLSDDEAWEVLQSVSRFYDGGNGINRDVLDYHAEMLFGDAPDQDDEAEGE